MSTHGRRTEKAIRGVDYKSYSLSSKEIYQFNHAWFLSPRLGKLFGFKFFKNPKLLEGARRLVSRITAPWHQIIKSTVEIIKKPRGAELRDENSWAYQEYTRIESKTKSKNRADALKR